MSVILEALRKTEGLPSLSPPPPDPGYNRIVRWICAALAVGCFGLALSGLAKISVPKDSPEVEEAVSPVTTAAPAVPDPEPAAETPWRLDGVLHEGGGKAVALINGRLVEEGSTFEGARVVRVGSDRVELEQDGETKSLNLQ